MTDKNNNVAPFSLKDAPALIEVLFPAQRVSIEVYKERMSSHGQTLVSLGGYWKGRKPLILNKACILGALLPATTNLRKDLEIFELLMAMDERSFALRFERIRPRDIVAKARIHDISLYFEVDPPGSLPDTAPFAVEDYAVDSNGKSKLPTLSWRDDVPETTKRTLEAMALPYENYRERAENAKRPESCGPDIHAHIWDEVNDHLGTSANSIPELVEQLGVMRYGRRPVVADAFSGSGQIPFEAARIGCDAIASDLNPIACMLTWGNFNVVGASEEKRENLQEAQRKLARDLQKELDDLGVETDGEGWRAKVFLYCLEATCTQSGGWSVPMLPTLVVSKGYKVIAKLVPDHEKKRYDIELVHNATDKQLAEAETGTIQSEGRGKPTYLVHTVDGMTYRTNIETLRGDYVSEGESKNRLRLWEKSDFTYSEADIFRERLYAIQWQKSVMVGGKPKLISEFRTVSAEDLVREQKVINHVAANLAMWQQTGLVPDSRIEPGDKTDEPIRTRGWTHWHHMFNPRQLLTCAILNKLSSAELKFSLFQVLNNNCRSTRWRYQAGGGGGTAGLLDNQALNTLYNYPARGSASLESLLTTEHKSFPLPPVTTKLVNTPANAIDYEADIFVTDPPYGDAVKYEEIFEFFIAWLRNNKPVEFSSWVWDSRRSLAVKGQDHNFKLSMVAAYKRLAEHMPDNGLQILMFTHQSGAIWADLANIVWASGLQVSAAWYVATEVEKRIQEQGSYVKGTILLALKKRQGRIGTFRDDLALELRDEVEHQVTTLTGLNQDAKELYRDENLFADADLQMAGYAAALRVLTRYTEIDGVDMTVEALRPREKGKQTRVDALIDYAVEIANQCLIPFGIAEGTWNRLQSVERFYLKMLDLESKHEHSLDGYQNFAKAFKVRDFHALMASERANKARLKSSVEFGRTEMSGDSELADTPLRGVLYALMELDHGAESDDVLAHLGDNVLDYFQKRDLIIAIADFMASRLPTVREAEASHARVLRDLVRNERLA